MLGNSNHNRKTITAPTSNSFLIIKECDLEDSSYEQFIDSGEEKWSGDDEKNDEGVLAVTQPTLESLLNNLTLEKPIIPSSIPQSTCINNRDPVVIRRNNSISWLSTAFRYEETTNDNLVIDVGSTETKPIILYTSKMKLIEKLTTVLGTTIYLFLINLTKFFRL